MGKTELVMYISVFYVIVFVGLGIYAAVFSDTTFSTYTFSPGLNITSYQLTPPTQSNDWNLLTTGISALVSVINFIILFIGSIINILIMVFTFLIGIIQVVQILPIAANTIIFAPLIITVGWLIISTFFPTSHG